MLSPYNLPNDINTSSSPPLLVNIYKKSLINIKNKDSNYLLPVDPLDDNDKLNENIVKNKIKTSQIYNEEYAKSLLYTNSSLLVWISNIFPELIPLYLKWY